VIIHGNHRAAVALHLGLDIRARFIPVKTHLAKTAIKKVPRETYGSYKGHQPEQSLYLEDKEIVPGQDSHILKRMQMIQSGDLRDRTVLEIGSRIGSHCFLAAHNKVKSVVGIESRPELASIAIRLNAFYAQPCHFEVQNLHPETISAEPADTVLFFSPINQPYSHTLLQKITRLTKQVLYLEIPTATNPDEFMQHHRFSSIEKIGTISTGTSREDTHALYRCTV
jgi:hypothetical protein